MESKGNWIEFIYGVGTWTTYKFIIEFWEIFVNEFLFWLISDWNIDIFETWWCLTQVRNLFEEFHQVLWLG
jgi:hypothetical protein